MKKYHLFLLLAVGVIFIGYAVFNQPKEKNKISSISYEIPFEISSSEMVGLVEKARHGDCSAAYRIGRHHSFVTLNFDEAIPWLRLAARCPNVEAKEELISLLLGRDNQPDISAEIDKLLLEIKQIDPKAAITSQEAIKRMRKK